MHTRHRLATTSGRQASVGRTEETRPETLAADSAPSSEILLLSTADWDSPLWTNKQYMARELAAAHPVTYVESLGLRRPQFTRRDLARIGRRVLRLVRTRNPKEVAPGRKPPASLTTVSPLVVPYHKGPIRLFNRFMLRASVPAPARNDKWPLLWTYTPVTYGLERRSRHCVYHCVDLLGAFPGIDPDVISRNEKRLARRGATAIASSPNVQRHLRDVGFRSVLLWPNVADVEPFLQVDGVRDPNLVVFGGNLSPHKFNADWMLHLVEQAPHVRVVLAGPVAEGGGRRWPALETLLTHPRVQHLGVVDVDTLAHVYATAAVGVIPYVDNRYTEGVNPLKVAEYLAAGLGVVSSTVPAVVDLVHQGEGHGVDIDLADSATSFTRHVLLRLGEPTREQLERRRATASTMSWTLRGEQARALVDEVTASPTLSGVGRGTAVGKRVIDLVGASVLLLAAAPVMAAVAAAVLICDGRPAVYRHLRVGRGFEPFHVYKFRTMRNGADREVHADGELAARYRANGFKLGDDDPRVTRLGRLLRSWSLDELPQLFNVLRGEMSLVGIRPLLADELALRSHDEQAAYSRLRPGITGLWQTEGRSGTTDTERRSMDLRYAEQLSIRNDVRILLRTVAAVVRRRGAC